MDANTQLISTLEIDKTIDLRGMECPLPVIKTKLALKALTEGQVLQVATTDPMSVVDLRVFCMRSGNELLDWQENDDEFEFFIRRINKKT
ncbi:MAG: sulfurtransferase TusA family protein [Gammaproteobacteria bacterium]|nr:sulfurtransferase TusA family protein [Gammaproteobacteria bacterium]